MTEHDAGGVVLRRSGPWTPAAPSPSSRHQTRTGSRGSVAICAGDRPVIGHCDAAWLNGQLHDDDIAELHALPAAAARATQVKHLLDGYGLPRGDRNGFVDRMIELAVHAALTDAVEYQVTPDSSEAIAADGYPILWGTPGG